MYKQKYSKYKSKYLNLKKTLSKTDITKKLLTNHESHNSDEYYYHGSPIKLKKLSPMPSKVINNDSAVFATNKLWLAVFFIAKVKDSDIETGFYNGQPYILEQYPGAIDKFLKNKKGYIYYLNKNNFYSDKRLGLQHYEFISKNEEKIVKTIEIPDIYQKLKTTEVNIITFDEKMKCVNTIIEKRKYSK